jgi:hypothetical protein
LATRRGSGWTDENRGEALFPRGEIVYGASAEMA